MRCAVYSSKNGNSLLLVTGSLWVVNGEWQLEEKDGVFYCVGPSSTNPIDIYLAGYIDYDGDYNSSLTRFQNGEGEHLNAKEEPPPIVPEFCKKKYYGIECSCSKCKNGKRSK